MKARFKWHIGALFIAMIIVGIATLIIVQPLMSSAGKYIETSMVETIETSMVETGGGGGATPLAAGPSIGFSPESRQDPYGQTRYYINPNTSKLNVVVTCTGAYGSPGAFSYSIKSSAGTVVSSGSGQTSGTTITWDGKNSAGNVVSRGEYKWTVDCIATPVPGGTAESIVTRRIFVDWAGPKAFKSGIQSGPSSMTLDFGTTYTKVSKIAMSMRRGGGSPFCKSSATFKFYYIDSGGTKRYLGESSGLGTQQWGSWVYSVSNATVRKVYGEFSSASGGFGQWDDCPYLDEMKSVLLYTK